MTIIAFALLALAVAALVAWLGGGRPTTAAGVRALALRLVGVGRKDLGQILSTFKKVEAELVDHITHHNAVAADARATAVASENSAAQATQSLLAIKKITAPVK